MLETLKIKNFALLKDITIEFEQGLNILTGETGAGKSIIIGALNLAAGERGSVENIRTGEEKAAVEAAFNLKKNPHLLEAINNILAAAGLDKSDHEILIKRELSRDAKGRVFINGSQVKLAVLQEAGRLLIDIHGQHEHQSLLARETHIDLLDAYAAALSLRNRVAELFSELAGVELELRRLAEQEAGKQEKLEMASYRIQELDLAGIKSPDELEKLIRDREVMVHTESLKEAAASALLSISPSAVDEEGKGAIDNLQAALRQMEIIAKIDPAKMAPNQSLARDALAKTEELKIFFRSYLDSVNFDKETLAQAEERISLIESLIKKYKKNSCADLLSYHNELRDEIKQIESNSGLIKEKEKEKEEILQQLLKSCAELTKLREKKSAELSAKIETELRDLGISKAAFSIQVEPLTSSSQEGVTIKSSGIEHRLSAKGADEIEFLISLNPGEEVKPLVKIASGGEISRIMLAIKNILSSVDTIPVMVFDEIDTGISGKIAQVTGKKIHEISRFKQLICITHLPQIAGFPAVHYSVSKEVKNGKTETLIRKLSPTERVEEVAKLLSGQAVTESSLKAAQELITESAK